MEALLTPRMSEEFKWVFFSKWKGGEGKNVEDDLIQEIFNKISKGAVQRMGANKTIDAISNICQATGGISQIKENVAVARSNIKLFLKTMR